MDDPPPSFEEIMDEQPTLVAAIPKNPDGRAIPSGWTEHYDSAQNLWIYVQSNVFPPKVSTVHPLGPAPITAPLTTSTAPENPDKRPLPPGWISRYDSAKQSWIYLRTDVIPPIVFPVPPLGPDPNAQVSHSMNSRAIFLQGNGTATATLRSPVSGPPSPPATPTFPSNFNHSSAAGHPKVHDVNAFYNSSAARQLSTRAAPHRASTMSVTPHFATSTRVPQRQPSMASLAPSNRPFPHHQATAPPSMFSQNALPELPPTTYITRPQNAQSSHSAPTLGSIHSTYSYAGDTYVRPSVTQQQNVQAINAEVERYQTEQLHLAEMVEARRLQREVEMQKAQHLMNAAHRQKEEEMQRQLLALRAALQQAQQQQQAQTAQMAQSIQHNPQFAQQPFAQMNALSTSLVTAHSSTEPGHRHIGANALVGMQATTMPEGNMLERLQQQAHSLGLTSMVMDVMRLGMDNVHGSPGMGGMGTPGGMGDGSSVPSRPSSMSTSTDGNSASRSTFSGSSDAVSRPG